MHSLSSRLGDGLPSRNLGLEGVVGHKGSGSTGVVGPELVRVSTDGQLVGGSVARSSVDSVAQPEMPAGLDGGNVVVRVLVLDVSGSQVDFVLVVGFKVFVAVGLC